MKRYEVQFSTPNTLNFSKTITALIIEPDRIGPDTGVMLFTHGWGGNRFQHEDKMEFTADAFDLVCVSVEYRQSGYAHDALRGRGYDCPYDASHLQVIDVLSGLRFVLDRRAGLNRRRLFHYGGSQGGHIALLSAVFAPRTFAFVYASCPLTKLTPHFRDSSRRRFDEQELAIRDVHLLCQRIETDIYLEYGTADETVPHEQHGQPIAEKLRERSRLAGLAVYEGGGHDLQPTICKLDAFKRMAPEPMRSALRDEDDDFLAGSVVRIPIGDQACIVDWSLGADDANTLRWDQ